MHHIARGWLTPKTPLDESQKLIHKTILVLLWSTVIGMTPLVIIELVQASYVLFTLMLIMEFLLLTLMVAMARGHFLSQRWLIPAAIIICITYILYTSTGITSTAILTFPLTIIIAGLLLGKRAAWLFTGISFLSMSFLIYAEIIEMITPPPFVADISSFMTAASLCTIIAVTLYTLIDNLNHNLARAQEKELQLAEANLSLQQLQTDLQNQVTQRTQQVEANKYDLEQAQATLKEQAWLATGIAQLNDYIRTNQTVPALSQAVIHYICQYIAAKQGALFISEADVLYLVGSAGYAERKHMQNQFGRGEGLPGQVFAEGKTLLFKNLPTSYLATNAQELTAVAPTLYLAPLLYNDAVFGVIELLFADDITAAQQHFLDDVQKNIAIAFSLMRLQEGVH